MAGALSELCRFGSELLLEGIELCRCFRLGFVHRRIYFGNINGLVLVFLYRRFDLVRYVLADWPVQIEVTRTQPLDFLVREYLVDVLRWRQPLVESRVLRVLAEQAWTRHASLGHLLWFLVLPCLRFGAFSLLLGSTKAHWDRHTGMRHM